jgi:hypothetical protein
VALGGWRLGNKIQSEAIWGILFKDTDRAAAIVAAIMLEDSLERKLKATLRDSTVFAKLFGTSRPLQFFGHRNQLAYVMRIYGKPFYQELETIGSIRNKFAHMYVDKNGDKPIKNFSSPIVKELCNKLVLVEHLTRAEEDRRDRLGLRAGRNPRGSSPLDALKHSRTRYIQTCGLCVSALNGHLDPEILKVIWADTLPSPETS